MRSIAFLAAFVAFCVAVPASADSWLIPADKIYTAPDAKPLSNGAVLIRDGRIASIADERSRLAIPQGTRTSECRGVIVAGFQNSHVHLTEDIWKDSAHAPGDALARSLEAMLTQYGFTTVFDTGSDGANTLALRARVEKGVRGPRILTVGLPLYPPDGIPFYIRDMPKELLDRLPQPRTAAEARAAVRRNLTAGADGTKLFLVTSPAPGTVKLMSLDVARAAVEETHAQGKLVLAHPTSLEGIRMALAAGVDVLVHTTLGEQAPWDAEILEQMATQHLSVIPTFKLWVYELEKDNAPQPVIDRLVGATTEELRAFKAAGGQVLFGTDVGYMHEYDPTDEYVFMSRAGLTPAQILASLTTEPAKRWKEEKRHGRVEPGFDADLVVLAADPADDVKNFAKVRCVYRAGKLIYASKAEK